MSNRWFLRVWSCRCIQQRRFRSKTGFFTKWNSLWSEFFRWFKKKRSDFFVESVIQSARKGYDVCGLYYQNDVESSHHVEKMNQNFEKKTVEEAIGNIQKLSDRQDSEEVRAIYGAGNYVFSTAYKQFFCAKCYLA